MERHFSAARMRHPDLMHSLKQSLVDSNLKPSKKRITWTASSICWADGPRILETVARAPDSYVPKTTIRAVNVVMAQAKVEGKKVDSLKIHLEHPKEEHLSAGATIDIFASSNFICPVKAFKDRTRVKAGKLSASVGRGNSSEPFDGQQPAAVTKLLQP